MSTKLFRNNSEMDSFMHKPFGQPCCDFCKQNNQMLRLSQMKDEFKSDSSKMQEGPSSIKVYNDLKADEFNYFVNKDTAERKERLNP